MLIVAAVVIAAQVATEPPRLRLDVPVSIELPAAPRGSDRAGPSLALIVAANAADVATTYWATGAGAMEANPLVRDGMEHPERLIAGKAIFGVLIPELTARWAERRGNRGGAKAARIAAFVIPAALTALNTRNALALSR